MPLLSVGDATTASATAATTAANTAANTAQVAAAATAAPDSHLAKVYFDVGSATLPGDAAATLSGVAATLANDAATTARISGFHDESGDPAMNAELAKQRAQAVQQWLLDQGIAAERVSLEKPAVTTGDGDAADARRVEVAVQ
ncbi:MAG: OmpA family protein [Pseudoxanthomonas sp.]